MIPVEDENVQLVNIDSESKSLKEKEYSNLLKKQIFWLNRHKDMLFSKSYKLYTMYINNKLDIKIESRCCNFKLLEEKCIEWNNKMSH